MTISEQDRGRFVLWTLEHVCTPAPLPYRSPGRLFLWALCWSSHPCRSWDYMTHRPTASGGNTFFWMTAWKNEEECKWDMKNKHVHRHNISWGMKSLTLMVTLMALFMLPLCSQPCLMRPPFWEPREAVSFTHTKTRNSFVMTVQGLSVWSCSWTR